MKIFVDENVPLITIGALREMGHDVLDIRGTTKEGMADDALWNMVQQEERLLVTPDKGFARHRGEYHHGILIVRLRPPNRRKIHQRVMKAMADIKPQQWPGLLVVMRDEVQSTCRADTEK